MQTQTKVTAKHVLRATAQQTTVRVSIVNRKREDRVRFYFTFNGRGFRHRHKVLRGDPFEFCRLILYAKPKQNHETLIYTIQ